jgi:hypothetical protein
MAKGMDKASPEEERKGEERRGEERREEKEQQVLLEAGRYLIDR